MFIPAAGWLASCAASLASYAACTACQCATREVLAHSARVAWSTLFFVSIVLGWVLRDFAKPLLEKIPWIVKHAAALDLDDDKWFGQQAVYRFSMGNFLFFITMSTLMVGVKYRSDKRDLYLHHGNWLAKLGLWLLFTALPFLFPYDLVMAYSWVARFGSGVFLVIQMVILLDFVQQWNDSWVAAADDGSEGASQWLYALLGLTVGGYGGAAALAGVSYWVFKPAGAGPCSLNVALITLALLLCVAFSVLSLGPLLFRREDAYSTGAAQRASIFPAAMISLYCMYLCFSALQSEPKEYECNGLAQTVTAASGSTLAVGMLVTLASVVYAAFRAGSNTRLFTLDGSDDGGDAEAPERRALLAEEATSAGLDGVPEQQITERGAAKPATALDDFRPVSYNYSFFHLIFALASMYIAMLMTGWGAQEQDKERIDIGWVSVWVKVAAQWVTGLLYAWTLIAPSLFPDRDFS